MTQARQDPAGINMSALPSISINVPANCQGCQDAATIIQAGLSTVGLNSQITLSTVPQFTGQYGSYSYNLQNAQSLPDISVWLGPAWQPYANTQVDAWASLVSNESGYGNIGIYYNSKVQACISAFFDSSNTSYIESLCSTAQAQIYNDAPFINFGTSLWDFTGTVAWSKSVVSTSLWIRLTAVLT